MALALPKLDNRTYDELVREGQRILPRRAPEWTDHNAHDPGITLIELFAWLVEQDIYRLDRTPDAMVRTFLRMVGIEPRPLGVAETVLELAPPAAAGPVALTDGLLVSDAEDSIAFETEAGVDLTPARLIAVGSGPGSLEVEHDEEDPTPGEVYLALGADPAPGDSLLLGFDAPPGAGGETVSLYLWTETPEADAETRERLIEEQRRLGTEARDDPATGGRPPDWRLHYSARTRWEYWTKAGLWTPLDGAEDQTRGLSLSGFVRFRVPADHARGGPWPDLWALRCRLVSGRYECPPVIDRIAINAVRALHAVPTPGPEGLGTSSGHANEIYPLGRGPAVSGSLRLHVRVGGVEDSDWHEVSDWDRVGPHDRAFRLDPGQRQISFGDGRIGRVLPAGAEILCRYRVGGGSTGNVAAGILTRAHGVPLRVHQPFPAFGGAEAETLDDARGRALGLLAEHRRAVALGDFEALALSIPGVPAARARALAGYHPRLPCVNAAGSVTLVVVPLCPAERPEPGPDFLTAVHRWVAPRCPLTTELHLVGPTFRTVAVHARLHVEPDTDTEGLAGEAVDVLDHFFHPLDGGPEGTGWPAGRDIYRSEVLAVLNAIDCVVHVDRLSLLADGATEASCANLTLCPTELAVAGEHQIEVTTRRQVR